MVLVALAVLLALPLGLYTALRDPFIQTFMVRSATTYLSRELGTTIKIRSFYIDLGLSLEINDLVVHDLHGNTLLSTGQLKIRPSKDIFSKLSFSKISMQNTTFQLIRYEHEEDLNMQFVLDYFNNLSDTTVSGDSKNPAQLSSGSLILHNANFRYWDQKNDQPGKPGMDYAHLNITDIQLELADIVIQGDSVHVRMNRLSARDTSGIVLQGMQATTLTYAPSAVRMKGLIIQTGESKLDGDLDFLFRHPSAFLDFIDSVRMEATFRESTLMMSDLAYFAEELTVMENKLDFSGSFKGCISDFSASDFNLKFGSNTMIRANVSLTGLPDIYSTYVLLDLQSLVTSSEDIGAFAIPIEGNRIPLPDEIRLLRSIVVDGSFEGYYDDFLTSMNVRTAIGNIFADLLVRKNKSTTRIHYSGQIRARNVNLSKMFDSPYAPSGLHADLRLDGKGVSQETINATIDGKIKAMSFMGNEFKDILLGGVYTENQFNGKVAVNDNKLKLDFSGLADFNASNPEFKFTINIPHADLFKLNLLKLDERMVLSTSIAADFTGLKPDDISGEVTLRNTKYADSRGEYTMEVLMLKSFSDYLFPKRLLLQCDFFDFELAGSYMLNNLGESLKQFLASYIGFEHYKPLSDQTIEQDFFISLKFKRPETLRRLFMPSLIISDDLSFTGTYTNRSQILNTTLNASLLGISGIKMTDVLLRSSTDRWQARVDLSGTEVIFRDRTTRDSTTLGVSWPHFSTILMNDSIFFQLGWNDQRPIARNKGDIKGIFNTGKGILGELRIIDADLIVNDSVWTIGPGNKVEVTSDFTNIEGLEIALGNQQISINGNLPFNEGDTLMIGFDQWDLSNFDLISKSSGIDLDGIITGDLQLANLSGSPAFFSNLHINKLFMNKEQLGDARIVSSWSSVDESVYLNAQLIHVGNVSTSRMLNLRGFYYPGLKNDNLAFSLSMDNFRIKALSPFMTGIISRIEGLASGEFSISGTLKTPEINGQLSLKRTGFVVDYLNTAYSLSHDFEINPSTIKLDNLVLYDTLGSKAIVNGSIDHDYLSNFRLNVHIQPDNFMALNTNSSMNELFYGSARVSGAMDIRGPFEDIFMNINAVTNSGTNIFIPLNTTTTIGDNDYIIFVPPADTSTVLERISEPRPTGQKFGLNLETRVTPDAGVKIFLPYNMGDLEAYGNGNLRMGVNSKGDFSLQGDYIIKSGQFNFVFENLVRRRFDLLEGGSISWTGDPLDANIDIRGLYKVKTSVSSLGLVLDSTSTYRNRVNVDCIIHLSDQLFNPSIKFSIELPNADDNVRQMVFSVLDTTNEAMMTQQMISLLVLGSFSYSASEQSGLGASSFNVLSNQLSNWLSQISKDFDIGLHYKPGDKISSEELEVALSTQLFNDRITIDGNFGVIGNRVQSQNASNIVGDIDVNFVLTKDGRLRLKAFSHSNVNSWYNSNAFENISPYTQGLGITYKQEFDNFGDLFRRKKKSSSKKSN